MAKKDEFIGLRACPKCDTETWDYGEKSVGPFPYKCKCNNVTEKVVIMRPEAKEKEKTSGSST
jgi:hypothetical protein